MSLRKPLLTAFLLVLPLLLMAQTRTIRMEMDWLHAVRGINFIYDATLNTDKSYHGPALKGLDTDRALSTLFAGSGIDYKRKGNYVTLRPAKKTSSPAPSVRRPAQVKAPAQSRQRHTISGYVRGADGETLINATVYDLTTHQGTTTNAYGFFSLTLGGGQHKLRFGYIGYDDYIFNVHLDADRSLDIQLQQNASLAEVVVTGDLNSPLLTTQTGKRSLSPSDIKTEYSLLSSPDVVKTLQMTSGVTTGVELASGLYVHGGDNDENLYLLDGSPLYSINHTLGLFSSFNVDVVKNVDFYKSGFPARYGGRLSSVVDVRTADGDFKTIHGSYRIGLIDGSFQIEGPLRKDKTSFNFGLRRSWLDLITRPVFYIRNKSNDPSAEDVTINYFFHDLNAKVTNVFSPRSRVSLSVYSGEDKLHTSDKYNDIYGATTNKDYTDERFSWGNLNAALDWQYRLSPKLFANFTAFYTYNRSRVRDASDEGCLEDGVETNVELHTHTYHSTIHDLGYRAAFDYRPSPHHHIRFGTDYTWHSFRPQSRHDESFSSDDARVDTTSLASRNSHYANEWNVYAEDEMRFNDHWSVNTGLNASLFHINGRTFASADPRFAVKYQVCRQLSLKASATIMSQYVHKIANTFLELPTDYWVPTTERLHPMKSTQFAGGVYFQPDSHWLLSLEGYVKNTKHILQYASWSGLEPPAENWDRMVMDGRGRFYGIEVDATYKLRRLQVQGSYTLSWNKRRYDEFYPGWYFDKFDNRHKGNISGRWNISQNVSAQAAWTFHSGNHVTVPTQYVHMPNVPDGRPITVVNGRPVPSDGTANWWISENYGENLDNFVYEKPNNITLPAYHRLDIGFDFRHKTRHGHEIVWNLSLYNVYCHLNSMWADIKFDSNERLVIRNHGGIPTIPSFSYTYKF